jgi:hypothetical protein
MTRLPLVMSIALAAFSAPASANYYIVYGPDRHCRVTERYLPGGEYVRVSPSRFRTRAIAERELSVLCRDNGYYRENQRAKWLSGHR